MQLKLLFFTAFVIFFLRSNAQWKPVNTGLTNLHVNALAVMDKNIFAGTEDGVFLSDNNGELWVPINNGLVNKSISSLAINGTTILAGTRTGIFKSTDSGSNWIPLNSGLTNRSVISLTGYGESVLARTEEGTFLSTNDDSWNPTDSGFVRLTINSVAITEGKIFVGIRSVFLSSDNGHNWKEVNSGLPNFIYTSLIIRGSNIFAAAYGGGVFVRPLAEMIPTKKGNELSRSDIKVNFYPNPFTTSATIEIIGDLMFDSVNPSQKPNKSGNINLVIYNLLGEKVRKVMNIEEQKITIDRENLVNGIYFFKLSKNNQQIATGKFIID